MDTIYALFICVIVSLKVANCDPGANTTAATTVAPTRAPTTQPTDAPTTVTTAAPVFTTVPPSKPKNYTFYVRDSTNTSCIIADMGTRFTFNISGQQETVDLQQKSSATNVEGTCNGTAQTMNISFTANNVRGDMWMYLTFVQSSGSFLLDSVSVGYPSGNSIRVASSNTSHYNVKAQLKHSYLCKSGITINDFQPNELTSVDFSQMQVEAFRETGLPDTFSQASSCEADAAVNQLVPIIVGAALAGLVIIVLIAYLVGRARNKRAGYESV